MLYPVVIIDPFADINQHFLLQFRQVGDFTSISFFFYGLSCKPFLRELILVHMKYPLLENDCSEDEGDGAYL